MAPQSLHVSVRDQIVPVTAGKSFFEAVRAIGAQSIEVAVDLDGSLPCLLDGGGSPHSIRDRTALELLRQRLDSEGVGISAFLLATDFSSGDAVKHIDRVVRTIRVADEMGVPVVRIDPLAADSTIAAGTVLGNVVRAADDLLSKTSGCRVDLGVENHGPIFNDPDLLDRLLDRVPDVRFGLTLDTGNLYWWGHPLDEVYALIDRYAQRAKHTHLKNIHYPPEIARQRRATGFEYKEHCCAPDRGDLDMRRVVAILRGAGYSRGLCIEDESLFKIAEGERIASLRQSARAAESAIANSVTNQPSSPGVPGR